MASLLVLVAAAFFFFGELTISTRNQFLHIQALNSISTYPEIVLVGFHPLGAILILASGFIPAVLLLGLLGSRIPASFHQIQSLSEVPDARSGRGISRVKGNLISARILWAALRQDWLLTIQQWSESEFRSDTEPKDWEVFDPRNTSHIRYLL